jgi:D-alanyl-D-alanine endopeptidase (penicillin-binding protein 7)
LRSFWVITDFNKVAQVIVLARLFYLSKLWGTINIFIIQTMLPMCFKSAFFAFPRQQFFPVLAASCLSLALISPFMAHAQTHPKANKKQVVTAKDKAVKPIKKLKFKVQANKSQMTSRLSAAPLRVSYGQMAGLHTTADPLDLRSSVALIIDQDTQEVLFRKNDQAVLPIASLTKLMTGLVISDADLSMSEMITISQDDIDTEKGSSSRLAVGTTLSRGDLLHLALMSSENRAAHALGRTFPGGMDAFVARMNARARTLGMFDTRFVEPTGLSSRNQSSAKDLAALVAAAYKEPVLRELSTSHGREIEVGRRTLQYNNTNRLVRNPEWDIGLQKTGYISEAGQCLVMQAQVAGRKLIMVFLDSAGKLSRIGDAERVRRWVERSPGPSTTKHSALDSRFPG